MSDLLAAVPVSGLLSGSFEEPIIIGSAVVVLLALVVTSGLRHTGLAREERKVGLRRPFIPESPVIAAILGPGLVLIGVAWLIFRDRQPLVPAGAAVIVAAALLVAFWICGYVPYQMRNRPVRRLIGPASARWLERPFLGWCRGIVRGTCWALGTDEDSVAIIGPPRQGKTAGLMVPNMLLWGGSAVSTSTKPDVLHDTHWLRRRAARRDGRGGRVLLYNPYALDPVRGVEPACWSPLTGCDSIKVCNRRVQLLLDTALSSDSGLRDQTYWREGASRILTPLFHAGACHGSRAGDFRLVRAWLDDIQRGRTEATDILRGLDTPAGLQLAASLDGVLDSTPPRELGSYLSLARNALRATDDPTVLASCSRTDIDLDDFLTSSSTLYIVAPTVDQGLVAPLIVALIDSLISRAYELHAEGRLARRVLFALDELPNIAPLPDLDRVVSQGASQGVTVVWAAQSLPQLRSRFGDQTADAIWASTTAHLVLGGSTDNQFNEAISVTVGEERVRTVSEHVPASDSNPLALSSSNSSGRRRETSWTYRRVLAPHQVREIPTGWALLLQQGTPPTMVGVRIAARCRPFRRLMQPPKD